MLKKYFFCWGLLLANIAFAMDKDFNLPLGDEELEIKYAVTYERLNKAMLQVKAMMGENFAVGYYGKLQSHVGQRHSLANWKKIFNSDYKNTFGGKSRKGNGFSEVDISELAEQALGIKAFK